MLSLLGMGVSPLVAGESPQDMGARLPPYLPGAPGWALDFNPGLGLAPGRAGEWPRGRRGRNSPGPRARGVTQGVGVGGQVQTGGQVATEAPAASSAAPWSGRASLSRASVSLSVIKQACFLPWMREETSPHPTPILPHTDNPSPGQFPKSVGEVWW